MSHKTAGWACNVAHGRWRQEDEEGKAQLWYRRLRKLINTIVTDYPIFHAENKGVWGPGDFVI